MCAPMCAPVCVCVSVCVRACVRVRVRVDWVLTNMKIQQRPFFTPACARACTHAHTHVHTHRWMYNTLCRIFSLCDTWTDHLQTVIGYNRLHCSTLPQWRLRPITGRCNPPYRLICRTITTVCWNSRATDQLSAHYWWWLQVPVRTSHWSPLSLVFHLQSTSTVTASPHQPDITRFCTETRV